jgi:hypothetical protein
MLAGPSKGLDGNRFLENVTFKLLQPQNRRILNDEGRSAAPASAIRNSAFYILRFVSRLLISHQRSKEAIFQYLSNFYGLTGKVGGSPLRIGSNPQPICSSCKALPSGRKKPGPNKRLKGLLDAPG